MAKATQSGHPTEALRVSVVGLGKLGAPFAACLASKGFHVTGVDVDPRKVQRINGSVPPVFEPGLRELLQCTRGCLIATDSLEEAVRNTDVTFILVATPSDRHGAFSLRFVIQACEVIGDVLRDKSGFHLVVLTSTVLPGATEREVRPVLESRSQKQCGVGFGLCYSPEFIALGSVIRDLFNPDFVLIGESDPRSGDLLASIYGSLCENSPPIARMNFVNAEITKLSVNTFVTTKITFANMLARICERLPGADVDVVTSALGLDARIGGKYLKGAIGYGGPCFPRDNAALAYLGRHLGSPAMLAEATESANRQEVQRLAELVKSRLPQNGVVGILGVTYKPNTDVVEESQGLLLAQLLLGEGISVILYDPAGMNNARGRLDSRAIFAASTEECVGPADIIVLATPWEEFTSLSPDMLSRQSTRRTLVDCWRVLEPKKYEAVVEYLPLGVGNKLG